jgi:5,6,7,8-tetrahydromethanopterin hydro-lyase
MSDFNQINEGRREVPLRPIGILALEPTDLADRFGFRFKLDAAGSSTAALLETETGSQYMLLRHLDAPLAGTEVLASELSTDPERDLNEFLQALHLDPRVVTWALDANEARAAQLEREQIQEELTSAHDPLFKALLIGEALVGDGSELARIELLLGSKSGPVGEAFANALVNQREGHTNVLAVVTPNLPAKPDTMITNKVTIKGGKQTVQMLGPAQAAVARAVVDSVAEGVIPKDQVDDLCLIVGVFIDWDASDDAKIYEHNYQAVKLSIARALKDQPSIDRVLGVKP